MGITMTVIANRGWAASVQNLRERGLGVAFALASLVFLYLALALVLPIDTDAPIVDEPLYASSALEWARTGSIQISGLSMANAVFDTIWGGLFARVLGETYGALRTSTLVLTALSGPFLYWMCRNLGAHRLVSLLATAAYLLNPLMLVLSATFMTDAHFTALVVMSFAFFTYSLTSQDRTTVALFAGSALASVAFLSRPQALVIPLAAALTLIFRSENRSKAVDFLALGALPAAVFVAHAVWTARVGAPFIRELSMHSLVERGMEDAGPFAGKLLLMASIYIGLIALPVLPLLRTRAVGLSSRRPLLILTLRLGLASLYAVMLISGYDPTDRQTWMLPNGLGAVERSHLGERPELWPGWFQGLLGLLAVFSTYVWAVNALGEWRMRNSTLRVFVFLSGGGLMVGALVAAMTFQSDIFDRYWLPLIPLIFAVAAASAYRSVWRMALSAFLISAIGIFGVLGTHDALTAHDAVAQFAEESVRELGISPLEFEGGAAWSAMTFGIADDGPQHLLGRPGPFWVKFYAVATSPEYGVALEPLEGYEIIASREFPSVLHLAPTTVYLIRGDPDSGYFRDADDF